MAKAVTHHGGPPGRPIRQKSCLASISSSQLQSKESTYAKYGYDQNHARRPTAQTWSSFQPQTRRATYSRAQTRSDPHSCQGHSAFNRSEIITRQLGVAPIGPVQLPRILGLEAAGLVEAAPGLEEAFPKETVVLAALGGMGIVFDGSYAEYVCVAPTNVQVVKTATAHKLGWAMLGALPIMLQTAHGSLFRSLKLKAGETLLIRGGTTSVGLAAAALAKRAGATVITTTRRSDLQTIQLLKENGADHVISGDNSPMHEVLQKTHPDGVDKILELVGGATLPESLTCLAKGGICCLLGLVGGSPAVPEFNPLSMIQTERYLTAYGERTFSSNNFPLK